MNFNLLIIVDCLTKDDINKIEKYLSYITCENCHNIMLVPKYCSICDKKFCANCKKCPHNNHKNLRHEAELIENIKVKCKFNCGAEPFPLSTILDHISKCPKKEMFFNIDKEVDRNSSNTMNSQSEKKTDKKIITEEFKEEDFNLEEFEDFSFENIIKEEIKKYKNNKNKTSKCSLCKTEFKDIAEYTKHLNECIKKNKIECNLSQLEKSFDIYREKLNKTYENNINILAKVYNDEIEKSHNEMENLLKQIEEKKKELNDLTQEINNPSILSEDYYKSDKEIQELLKEQEELLYKRNEQIKLYKSKCSQIKNEIRSNKSKLISDNKSLIENYMSLSEESDNLYTLISLSATKESQCALCRDEKSEKYFCAICRKKYCVNKCAQKCKNSSCNTYLCTQCSACCNLCNKKKYCEKCLKKCFYINCKNKFCPECYKKNEYQARESNKNCSIFTCDDEAHNVVCLMTTLYCPKCEKRMCNECLMKDKEHLKYMNI